VLQPGAEIPKGSVVDLVLGDGGANGKAKTPALAGMTVEEAILNIKGNNLSVGRFMSESGKMILKPSSKAKVIRQAPSPDDEEKLAYGQAIDLWVKDESKKDEAKKDETKKEKP